MVIEQERGVESINDIEAFGKVILGIVRSYERRNKRLIVQNRACFWCKCNMTK
jgi:hypothetical protein